MDFIQLTKENIDNEHICCAISNNNDIQVSSKKAWLNDRLEEGLVFLKANTRGKCFIEYIPAEHAWIPISANDYMVINCLWVAGSLKGNGYANKLLESCIEDSKKKGKKGLCILSSKKKKGFLADSKYLIYKGFKECDETPIGITLMYLSFADNNDQPKFKDCAKICSIEEKGFVLYYTHQCPFTAKYVPIIESIAREHNVPFKSVLITSYKQAQTLPSPCTTYALFFNGKFITHEIQSDKKFIKLIENFRL